MKLLMFVLIACVHAHADVEPTFVQRVEALNAKTECDLKDAAARLEFAKIFDAKKFEIESVLAANPNTSYSTFVKMGPLWIGEQAIPIKSEDKWFDTVFSWDWIIKDYEAIKDQPLNPAWMALYGDFKVVLAMDEDRILYEYEYLDPSKFVDVIKEPKKLSYVKRIDEGTFEVPVFAQDLNGYEKELTEIIEAEWSNSKYRVKINWLKSLQNVFVDFIINAIPDQRSFVSYNDDLTQTHIVLNNVVRKKSISHEFGHALGFADRYQEFRDEKACEYIYMSNRADIMSSSNSGRVLPYHWEMLDRVYPSNMKSYLTSVP